MMTDSNSKNFEKRLKEINKEKYLLEFDGIEEYMNVSTNII
jgi:hypothetical protein